MHTVCITNIAGQMICSLHNDYQPLPNALAQLIHRKMISLLVYFMFCLFLLCIKPWVLYVLNAYFSARGPFDGLCFLLVSLIPCNFVIACNYRKTRTFNRLNAYFSARVYACKYCKCCLYP